MLNMKNSALFFYLFIIVITICSVIFFSFENSKSEVDYNIILNCDSLVMKKGNSLQLNYSIFPNYKEEDIVWESSNSEVISINKGEIKASNIGNANVTLKINNSFKSCNISVLEDVVDVEKIEISKSDISFSKGANYTLTVDIYPSNASNKNVIWESSNTNVANVENGVVTGVSNGSATITAKTFDGNIVDSTEVTIVDVSKKEDYTVKVSDLSFDLDMISLEVDEKKKVNATISPSNATNKNIIWKSSNEKIIKVNNGEIIAVSEGNAYITATSIDGNYTDKISVIVNKKSVLIDKIILNLENVYMYSGETKKLVAELIPSNATNKNLAWKSSNEKVVIVNEGNLMAMSEGNAVISVSSINGITAKATVIVEKVNSYVETDSVSLNYDNVSLFVGDSKTLIATVSPTNATNKNIIWKSSNDAVVKVNNGILTGVGEGTATISATTYNGKTSKVSVSVKKKSIAVESVNFASDTISLSVGEIKKITANVLPSDATNKKLTWKSNNESIVKVNNGELTGVSSGSTKIIVSSSNGKTDSIIVNVNNTAKIHFLGNGDSFSSFMNSSNVTGGGPSPSETIILESNGKFALIDAGLSNSNADNPNRAKAIIKYLKRIGANELEFMLITHVHYDHMGGASYVLDNMKIKKLYSKVYYANDKSTGTTKSNNTKRYETLYNKAIEKNIFQKVNANLEGKSIDLGIMDIYLYATKNLLYYNECYNEDENINSIITYIVVNGKKILLTGDMEPTTTTCLKKFNSNCSGKSITECVVKTNNISKIDLLKLPHHGYSSCDINSNIVSKLSTKNIVIPNWSKKINYYYKGIENDNGVSIGPYYDGYSSCRGKYFSSYSNSGSNRSSYYINEKNFVFDFSGDNMKVYNN